MSQPLNVLVLDSQEDVRSYLSTRFSEQSFKVQTVTTAEDAYEQACKNTPWLIIVNGDDAEHANAISTIKTEGALRGIRVVMITSGNMSEAIIDQWFSNTPPDFTVKRPIHAGFLDEHLQSLLPGAEKPTAKTQKGKSKEKGKEDVPVESTISSGDSHLVKALTDQLAALDEELRKLRSEAAERADDTDASSAIEAAKAAQETAIAERDQHIIELKESLARQEENLNRQQQRLEEMEEARSAQLEASKKAAQ